MDTPVPQILHPEEGTPTHMQAGGGEGDPTPHGGRGKGREREGPISQTHMEVGGEALPRGGEDM